MWLCWIESWGLKVEIKSCHLIPAFGDVVSADAALEVPAHMHAHTTVLPEPKPKEGPPDGILPRSPANCEPALGELDPEACCAHRSLWLDVIGKKIIWFRTSLKPVCTMSSHWPCAFGGPALASGSLEPGSQCAVSQWGKWSGFPLGLASRWPETGLQEIVGGDIISANYF